MRFSGFFSALSFASLSTMAQAHGPTPQKIDESIEIKAEPKTVWKIIGNFSDIGTWDPKLKASEGSGKNRILVFKNNEKLVEEADEIDPEKMTYSYRMLDPNLNALPASSYSATLIVSPSQNGGSQIKWYARAYRGDTGNEPPDNLSDTAVTDALSKFFRAGLNGIKAKAEK